MRILLLFLLTTVSGFCISASGCANPGPQQEGGADQPQELLTGPPAELPKAPRSLLGGASQYDGKVSAIGRDWVELAPGWKAWGSEVNQKNNDKPKRISAAGTAPGGDQEMTLVDISFDGTHLLTDLKVGDVVVVSLGVTKDRREWATAISIRRRPGGKIPPMPRNEWGVPDEPEKNQAYQDWEEKGIPIPKRFLDSDGRMAFTNPPYPPVAPMPRPAKR